MSVIIITTYNIKLFFREQEKPKGNAGVNYFDTVTGDSDDSSNDSDHSNKQDVKDKGNNSERLPNPLLEPLPSASSTLQTQPGASVFVSQYHIAEKEKESVLEKHVKLSATKIVKIGKKLQICHKFRQGKCRFGKNCKYSHDIDSCSKQAPMQDVPFDQETGPRTGANFIPLFKDRVRQPLPGPEYIASNDMDKDDDSYMGSMKRKRRAGLAASLVPSKKALSGLNKQRETERPWTVGRNK